MNDLSLILLALLLVFVNGFFVAAEFALVKLRITQAEELAEEHGLLGRTLLKVRSQLDAHLSACQLGITLASLGLGWLGEPAFSRVLTPLLINLGVDSPELQHSIAVAIAFSLISYLHIVLGELAPKSFAIREAETLSLWAAVPLFSFHWLMKPFIFVLNGSAALLLKRFGVELAEEGTEPHSAEEIKKLLADSQRHGELGSQQAQAMSRTLELPELSVGELMRPLFDLVSVDIRDSFADSIATIARHRYSRYAVRDSEQDDHYIGLIHVRDLFAALQENPQLADLRPLLREIPVVPREEPAQRLFRRFRRGLPHLALVSDEIGRVVGFITLEHILEAIFGRMQDEFRRARSDWTEVGPQSFEGPGWLPIYTLERLLERDIEAPQADTIGGLVMQVLDRLPQNGDVLDHDDLHIEVLEVAGPRIGRLRVSERRSSEDDERGG